MSSSSSSGRLPLPQELLAMPGGGPASAIPTDDPVAHQGRSRSFPAERGQWATSVHCPAAELLDELGEHRLEAWRAALAEACQGAAVHPVDSPHLSLSRTVILRHHQIGAYADSLRSALSDSACCPIVVDRLIALPNDDCTRTFFALGLAEHCAPACEQLVARVDSTMLAFGLPAYYEQPQLHVSVLWTLGDRSADRPVQQLLNDINSGLAAGGGVGFLLDQVVCRAGNKEFMFSLS